MDITDLITFETVARLGGISRAAETLNTVQSNVTTRVRNLEHGLGTTLFQRHSRGVTLTPAGERLLPYARRVQALLDEAQQAVADDGRPSGALTIGSLETTAALRLSPVLARFASEWPEVDLVLRTGTTREMVDAVLDRQVEGAFVCGPVADGQAGKSALEVETVYREELVLVTSPWAGDMDEALRRPPSRGRDNSALKIAVLRAGCSYRQRLEDILARRGLTGLRVMEFGTIDALMAAAGAGIGVTLLPRGIAAPVAAQNQVRLHRLPPAESDVDTLFVRRKDSFYSSALSAFLDLARASQPVMGQAA